MKLIRFIFLLSCFLILGCGNSDQDRDLYEIETEWIEKGPVKAQLKLKKQSLSVLDTQHMTLEIISDLGVDVETPHLEDRLEDFEQVPWRSDKIEKGESSQSVTKYFALQNFESGEQVIPSIEVRFYQSSGNEQSQSNLKIPSQFFTFTPVEDMSLVERELQPPLGLMTPKPFPWLSYIAIAIAVIAILVIIINLIARRLKKPKAKPAPPPIPAHILAWRELEALVERQKSGELSSEIFVAELSDVLRRYIERRFELRAPELTTEEFLNLLIKDGGELKTQQDVLKQFLEFTDLVKFANQKVKDEDVEQGFEFIKTFIQQSKVEDVKA